jgi:hypothetical protein
VTSQMSAPGTPAPCGRSAVSPDCGRFKYAGKGGARPTTAASRIGNLDSPSTGRSGESEVLSEAGTSTCFSAAMPASPPPRAATGRPRRWGAATSGPIRPAHCVLASTTVMDAGLWSGDGRTSGCTRGHNGAVSARASRMGLLVPHAPRWPATS